MDLCEIISTVEEYFPVATRKIYIVCTSHRFFFPVYARKKSSASLKMCHLKKVETNTYDIYGGVWNEKTKPTQVIFTISRFWKIQLMKSKTLEKLTNL